MALLGLAPLVPAQWTVDIWDDGTYLAGGTMPNYYSGTNCRAWVKVSAAAPLDLSRVEFLLNGEVVADISLPPGPYGDRNSDEDAGAMFDSTHFDHGTTITVQARVHFRNAPPRTVNAPATVPVYNRAFVFGTDHVLLGNLSSIRSACIRSLQAFTNHNYDQGFITFPPDPAADPVSWRWTKGLF